ncbi:MAG: ATP synthase F0 subunit B [Thermodesulfovibrionales bacterium]|nr:ATP synthase F0 subunit B [Thermodesulfovibrionales bacterium]
MLEFNQWYFVLVANFIILYFILSSLLFKPLAKLFKERENTIKGAYEDAKAMNAKKDENAAKMNAELQQARKQAKDIYNSIREAGISYQTEVLRKAEEEAVAMIERARQELKLETEKARAILRADVDKLSEEIVRKLVKA